VTTRPVLALVRLSDSFAAVWKDMAAEAGADLVSMEPETETPPSAVAVLIAAGGEEQRGIDLVTGLAERSAPPIYFVGAEPSHRFAVEAVRRGAADYFALPEDADLLRRTLAARIEAGHARAAAPLPDDDPFTELLGESPSLREALDRAARVMRHGDVTVLIGGETGTGKELLARALHRGGPRRDGAFVAVNCAAIPAQLLESELFGHEKGAFTDAHRTKPGLFEEADGGTLFLDEIGHLPIELQGKLLRALDERRVRRVGANQDRAVDVRIIAATHVDLHGAVAAGEFREDLYYRLNVVHLVLPPLRERGDDVMVLARTFATTTAARYGLPEPRLGTEVRDALRAHAWPGNVRELRHAVERALLLSPPGTLDAGELVPRRPRTTPAPPETAPAGRLADVIRAAAEAVVARHGGNKSAAARTLGISRARLQRILEQDGGDDADAE